jgi:hypothetical protein
MINNKTSKDFKQSKFWKESKKTEYYGFVRYPDTKEFFMVNLQKPNVAGSVITPFSSIQNSIEQIKEEMNYSVEEMCWNENDLAWQKLCENMKGVVVKRTVTNEIVATVDYEEKKKANKSIDKKKQSVRR